MASESHGTKGEVGEWGLRRILPGAMAEGNLRMTWTVRAALSLGWRSLS